MNSTVSYRKEIIGELQSILRYWMEHMPDDRQGGFFGRIDGQGRVHAEAPRGLVLNSRILWSFSAAYRNTGDWIYLPMARRAYVYLRTKFLDSEYGGAFWSVAADGTPLETRKQVYGLAFCLYGLSEYYMVTGEQAALETAISLFRLIEQHGFDIERKGYYEAFTRDWQSLDDLRLSEKEPNEQKTMNTHLHVLEAYTNLYHAWPDVLLQQRINDLLEVFALHIQSQPRKLRPSVKWNETLRPHRALVAVAMHRDRGSFALEDTHLLPESRVGRPSFERSVIVVGDYREDGPNPELPHHVANG